MAELMTDYVMEKLRLSHQNHPNWSFETAAREIAGALTDVFWAVFLREAKGSARFTGYATVVGDESVEISISSVLTVVTIDVMRKYAQEYPTLNDWAMGTQPSMTNTKLAEMRDSLGPAKHHPAPAG